MHETLCLCSARPQLNNATPVSLILHQLELKKTTNTGRLALACLQNKQLHVRGRGADGSGSIRALWPHGHTPLLLFPAEAARPVADVIATTPGPYALVVPDGTWSQARRTVARMADLSQCVPVLPPAGPPSRYRLRTAPGATHLCTLEAIARTLGELEGPARGPKIQKALEDILAIMVDRTLWSRGALSDGQVPGGVPEAARLQRARAGGKAHLQSLTGGEQNARHSSASE